MKADDAPVPGGIGTLILLGLLFFILKLTGHIDWSWWWVTAPIWGFFSLLVVFVLALMAFPLLSGDEDD